MDPKTWRIKKTGGAARVLVHRMPVVTADFERATAAEVLCRAEVSDPAQWTKVPSLVTCERCQRIEAGADRPSDTLGARRGKSTKKGDARQLELFDGKDLADDFGSTGAK